MAATSTAGTKFYVGTTKATATGTAAEFASDTYTEVKGLMNLGELGGTIERGTVDRIDTGTRDVFKGVKDLGEPEFEFQYIPADPGQVKMDTAYGANAAYNFKIVLSDASVAYVKAFVMSAKTVTGGISDPVKKVYGLARTDFDNIAGT